MFKVGDFSRLTQVPITTLHHYDEIGLFKPARLDRFTGYRYYTFDQLPRLNRILALRGLGFTLDQIAHMLGEGDQLEVNADQLRGMLQLRRAELQQQVDSALEKLAQVELRLRQIEEEDQPMDVEVLVKQVKPVTMVGAREVVTEQTRMRERCMALNDAACALIEAAHLKTDGVSFALYYSGDERGIDVEMGYEVKPPVASVPENGARLHILPAAKVAYAVYHGSYDDFGAVGRVHGALASWIEANGYRMAGASREYYLRPPQGPNDPTGVMEIQYPIEG